jgi:AraC family transcriptional regulator
MLGISCVEKDPSNRAFYYMIAIEEPEKHSEELESYHVPASEWAVFECVGKVPEAIVKSEIYAFKEWLPSSGYKHAKAPEMEVYFPENDGMSGNSYCEFWLPIIPFSMLQRKCVNRKTLPCQLRGIHASKWP